jgi:acyl-CoA thioesterase-2
VLSLLQLAEVGRGRFVGYQPDEARPRVFGGQIAAQALMAGAHTADDRSPRSLHLYFLRRGDVTAPVDYDVDSLQDGRTISVRRITATQHGKPILAAMASFGATAGGVDYHRPMPTVPSPECLPRIECQLAPYAEEHDGWWIRPRAFDIRYISPPPRIAAELPTPPTYTNQLWMRADGPVPSDPVLACALLTYASDLTLLDPVMKATGRTSRGPGLTASLDHALWFHRPPVLSEWLLYDQFSPSASGGRGLVCGSIFNRGGELMCTVNQEGYLGDR